MHDPLAAYYVIDNTINDHAQRWKTSKRVFLMERKGEWTKGTCVVDRRYSFFSIYHHHCLFARAETGQPHATGIL